MENQNEAVNPAEEKKCCGSGYHRGSKHGFCMIRFFLLIVILVVVFSLGMAFGRIGSYGRGFGRYENYYGRHGGYGMTGQRYFGNWNQNDSGQDPRYFNYRIGPGSANNPANNATNTPELKAK